MTVLPAVWTVDTCFRISRVLFKPQLPGPQPKPVNLWRVRWNPVSCVKKKKKTGTSRISLANSWAGTGQKPRNSLERVHSRSKIQDGGMGKVWAKNNGVTVREDDKQYSHNRKQWEIWRGMLRWDPITKDWKTFDLFFDLTGSRKPF